MKTIRQDLQDFFSDSSNPFFFSSGKAEEIPVNHACLPAVPAEGR
jgi:hypothetical protein